MNKVLFAWMICTLVVGSFASCGSRDKTESNVSAEVDAMVAPIEQAIANPSGTVDENNAPKILEAARDSGTASAFGSYLPSGAPQSKPMGVPPSNCVVASSNEFTIDLACATKGESTGTIRYATSSAGGVTYVLYELIAACTTSKSGNTCVDGKGGYKLSISGQTTTWVMSGKFTITTNGNTQVVSYGYQVTSSAGTYKISYAVYVNGQSYVIDATFSEKGGKVTVTGKNGSYTCSYTVTSSGVVGSCSKDGGSFSFGGGGSCGGPASLNCKAVSLDQIGGLSAPACASVKGTLPVPGSKTDSYDFGIPTTANKIKVCATPPGTEPVKNGFNAPGTIDVSFTPANSWTPGATQADGALYCREYTRAGTKGEKTSASLQVRNANTSISSYCIELRFE